MIFITVIFLLATKLITIHSTCTEFKKEWKTCPPELYPSATIDNTFCAHKINSSEKVIIDENKDKLFAINCSNDVFPDGVFDCLPFNNSKHLILRDCRFPQEAFDRYFSNSHLKELTILNPNSRFLQTSLSIHNLPRLKYLSLKHFYTYSYFDLSLASLPLMRSIIISNSTFTSLPQKSFQQLSQLKGLALTAGMLENIPDDFLYGTNLQSLDLSINMLKNFQPNLLRNLKDLKNLNLSYNLLEEIDENLFKDSVSLEKLSLDHNRISVLSSDLFKTLLNLKILSLNHNQLKHIPNNIFQGLKQILLLSLNNNRLSVLPPGIFNDLASLMILSLQSNHFHLLPETLFAAQSRLHYIDLSQNKISKLPSSAPFGNNRYLSQVNLSDNSLDEFLHLNWSLYNISQLDLSDNLISEVVIPISAKPGGLIYLQRNQINKVKVMKNLNSDYRYFLEGNPFVCNCNLGDLINSLSLIADAKELVCHEPWYRAGKYISDFKNKTKLCEVKDDCPLTCKCHLLQNDEVEVNCKNTGIISAAFTLPIGTTVLHLENNEIVSLSDVDEDSWIHITHLYLSYNSLMSLQNWTIPPKLQLLAIDGNRLTELPSSVMERIGQSEKFQIYLKENDWPCDCQIIPLKTWIVNNLAKIKDSALTYCRPHKNGEVASLIANSSLDEFGCQNSQYLISNKCAKTEIYLSASVFICFLLNFINKMY